MTNVGASRLANLWTATFSCGIVSECGAQPIMRRSKFPSSVSNSLTCPTMWWSHIVQSGMCVSVSPAFCLLTSCLLRSSRAVVVGSRSGVWAPRNSERELRVVAPSTVQFVGGAGERACADISALLLVGAHLVVARRDVNISGADPRCASDSGPVSLDTLNTSPQREELPSPPFPETLEEEVVIYTVVSIWLIA